MAPAIVRRARENSKMDRDVRSRARLIDRSFEHSIHDRPAQSRRIVDLAERCSALAAGDDIVDQHELPQSRMDDSRTFQAQGVAKNDGEWVAQHGGRARGIFESW